MFDNNLSYWNSIRTIDKRLRSFKEGYRQNIALLGDKSRIDHIHHKYIPARLESETVIYANASYAGDREIFNNIAYSILSGYLKSYESLDRMISAASYILPSTTTFIKDILKTKGYIPFLKSLELINKFINETTNRCIFILDEFTELKKIYKNFYYDFSQFIIFQNKCMIIITSSKVDKARDLLSSELNFLFGNFERIHLDDNACFENYLYLKDLLEPIKPTPAFLSFFVNAVGTNISYLDIIASEVKNYYSNDEMNCIRNVMTNILLKEESCLFQRFIARIEAIKSRFKDYTTPLKLILTISAGYIRKKELVSLNIIREKSLTTQLNRLLELGYISNNGDVYKIKDDLFSLWLSHVFSYYFYPSVLDTRTRERLFKLKLKETVEIFNEAYFKDATERIADLIATFNNDYLKVRKQKIRLPRIERTKMLPYPEERFRFLVGEGKDIIFVGIKKNTADDADIVDYIEKTRVFKNKKVKKIFITLNNFSTSARIIAKENKLITWDINEINELLKIYHKPIIINENTGNFRHSHIYDKGQPSS